MLRSFLYLLILYSALKIGFTTLICGGMFNDKAIISVVKIMLIDINNDH